MLFSLFMMNIEKWALGRYTMFCVWVVTPHGGVITPLIYSKHEIWLWQMMLSSDNICNRWIFVLKHINMIFIKDPQTVSRGKWDNVVILCLYCTLIQVYSNRFLNMCFWHWYLGIRLTKITDLCITMGCAGCELWQCELVSVNKIEHTFVYPCPRLVNIMMKLILLIEKRQ